MISGDKLVYKNEDGSIREIEKNLSTYTASASARQLVKQIEGRIKALDQRRWTALKTELAREHQERMGVIKAARDVAVAQAKRPVTFIHQVNVWW